MMTDKEKLIGDCDDSNTNYSSIETMPCQFDNLPAGTNSAVSIQLLQEVKRYVVFCYDVDEVFISAAFKQLT